MNGKKKLFGIALSLALTVGLLAGCSPASNTEQPSGGGSSNVGGTNPTNSDQNTPPAVEPVSMDEFVFAGSSSSFEDGKEYHFSVEGEKDGTFYFLIDEFPAIDIPGTYTYVENKGYKFYFEDEAKTEAYTTFDPATKTFSFDYTLNLGEGIGRGTVKLTLQNDYFATIYDGEGLGAAPPVFTGSGWGSGNGHVELPVELRCYEDGTCRVIYLGETANFITSRTGKWSYDSASNVYHIDFDYDPYPSAYLRDYDDDGGVEYKYFTGVLMTGPDGNPRSEYEIWDAEEGERDITPTADSEYDAATNTYTLKFVAVSLNYVAFTTTYTPAN